MYDSIELDEWIEDATISGDDREQIDQEELAERAARRRRGGRRNNN